MLKYCPTEQILDIFFKIKIQFLRFIYHFFHDISNAFYNFCNLYLLFNTNLNFNTDLKVELTVFFIGKFKRKLFNFKFFL